MTNTQNTAPGTGESRIPLANCATIRTERRFLLACLLVVLALLYNGRTQATEPTDLPEDLSVLSLESLMDIEITSVSKRAEKLSNAAAAVYVLTGDEIRRSGARTIPDALRLVPGLTVAQIDAHTWAVTARGFNSALSDKMEVLLDGRSLYTPLFSGVFWEEKNSFIQDIDRIEVIRGPGAALWGANAVNGVINILTKSSADTQGSLVEFGAGSGQVNAFAGLRHGGKLGETGTYRAYVQTTSLDENQRTDGMDANDGTEISQAGFRSDWSGAGRDRFSFQGDVYDGTIEKSVDSEIEGYNLIGNWSRSLRAGGELAVRLLHDHYVRDDPTSLFRTERDTYNIDITHRFRWRPKHEIVWGGGYWRSSDDIESPFFIPDSRTLETFNLFVQDQIDLSERLKLTIGSKFEDNDFTGFEVQPSLRFAYLLDERRTVWGAVSRAVRTPNRVDHDIVLLPLAIGSEDFESETVIAYELGYRNQLRDDLSIDIATYYNVYDDLRGVNNAKSPPEVSNEGDGEGYGIELSALWHPNDHWNIRGAYTYQNLDFTAKSGSTDNSIEGTNRNDPHHQLLLSADWRPRHDWSVNAALRYVSGLPDQDIGGYTELDLRLAWQLNPHTEIGLTGRNLLHDSHAEFGSSNQFGVFSPVELDRSLIGTVTWRFD